MPLSDEAHLEFMQKTAECLGQIKATSESTLSFVKAVNENQKKTADELQKHAMDPAAHGETTRRDTWGKIGGVVAIIVAVGSLVVSVVMVMRSN